MTAGRGYFGVGVYHPKNEVNIGTLFRSAYLLGASFIFTIGKRYKHQSADTYKTPKHVPLFHYESFEDFQKHRPKDCILVGVELTDDAQMVDSFVHPERAIYLLGAEDNGLPQQVISKCNKVVKLRGERSMNVATAGSIVMYLHTLENSRESA